jgi:Lar family restriction alleviation protein
MSNDQLQSIMEPLPCPFCGHVGLDFREGSTFRWIIAECSGCGASRGEARIQTLGQGTKEEWMADAQQDAIAEWNRRAPVEAIAAPGVAQGWVMVPVEPTPTMLAALWAYKANTLAEQYAAMLAAAPSPTAEQPIKGGTAE